MASGSRLDVRVALQPAPAPAAAAGTRDSAAPPNVLVLYVDDLGYGDRRQVALERRTRPRSAHPTERPGIRSLAGAARLSDPHNRNPTNFYRNGEALGEVEGYTGPFVNGLPAPPTNLEARGPGEYWANVTYLDHQIGRLLERRHPLATVSTSATDR